MAVLDTSFLIDWMRETKQRQHGSASAKFDELLERGEPLRIAIFTVGELYVGVAKGSQSNREAQAVEYVLQFFDVVKFENSTAKIWGMLVGHLEKRGIAISELDALIASVALEIGDELITRNVRHFARVPGLQVATY